MLPFGGWAFSECEVFDDADQVVVRVEVPGMRREGTHLELHFDSLAVRGGKRCDREVNRDR